MDINFHWNWTDFCPTGLEPFAAASNDLLPCFQELALQFPVYSIFASISAYNFGWFAREVTRNQTQIRLLHFRILITFLLALLPVCKVFALHHVNIQLYASDILVVSAECIMWIVHCGYLLSACRFGVQSHRGPLVMNVFYLMIYVLDCIWLYTSRHYNWWPWSLVTVLLDTLYGLSLLPKGNAIVTSQRHSSVEEEQSLLSRRFTYFQFDLNESHLGHAQDDAHWASRLFFNWVEPLISKGVAEKLQTVDDLFDLPDCLNIIRLSERLQLAISHSKNMFWALQKAFGKEFYLIGILRFISDICGFAGPLLLGGLLSQKGTSSGLGDEEANYKPYLYGLGLLGTTVVSAMCGTHFDWRMSMVSMKMRTSVISAIYRKALEARGLKNSRPEILNLMSTDTDRIVNSCISFHSFWSIPFQLFTTLYLLYTQLGAAFIAGLVFAVALIPLNRWLAQRICAYSKALMEAKDARLATTSEVMNGAKPIKLHAWEDVFIQRIGKLRKEEVTFLSKRKYLDALCVYFWATTPVLMSFLTFGVLALMGKPLIAANTYTSVALLNMLIGPLNAFPWVLNGLVEAWISVKRVQELIDLPNLDLSSYYNPIMKGSSNVSQDLNEKPNVVQLKNATFEQARIQRNNEATDDASANNENTNNVSGERVESFRLSDVNVDIKRGDLVCVEGPVGGGKSTLIGAIAADIECRDGVVCLQDLSTGFGYVPQTPWLQRGTIRDNIIWGSTYDESWYKMVLYACALNDDLQALGGDLIGVGENGFTLSGGQRARVALARAVYQDKKIYLMDDILASLDAHVARHIIKYCILGVLKDKTRIVVTRNSALFLHANQILHVADGQVTSIDYMSESADLSLEGDEMEVEMSSRKNSIDLDDLRMANAKKKDDDMLQQEARQYGNISVDVIGTYWKAVTTPLSLLVLVSAAFMQISRNLSDGWLAHWVTDSTHDNNQNDSSGLNHIIAVHANDTPDGHTVGYFLGVYAALTIGNSVLTLARAFLFAYGGIKAAKFIHDCLLKKVMFAKFSFFDVTAVGRILNRFSSDTYTVDDSLPFMLNILLAQFIGLVGVVIVSLYAMPWLCLIIVPMFPIYWNLQQRYRHASRDIKRLSSNALSPLYSNFTETLQGLATIRTMRAGARFQRDFHDRLEESLKSQLTASAAQKWLSLRLQLLGALLVGGAGLLAATTSAHSTNPGLVGLAISYALSVTGLLSGLLNAIAETEQEFIAVERIDQYMQLDGEQNVDGTLEPPFGWPSHGTLTFDNVQLRYREHYIAALHDISFKTEAFERIAIVGRTGAGKSSLLSALMRVAPLSHGEITIDCVNLKTLALRTLRERIGVIPQEAFLFKGTVRENLDPRHAHHDAEIWHAITNCHAATQLVQSLGGLDGRLDKGGINLSAGQRQLLCLARILLKNSKVVCIDEGTCNLDDESEFAMHQALRNCFKSATVLFIAHRLKGLEYMDRVIVMDQGAIKEQGTPADLAQNTASLFHDMLQAQKINTKDYIRK